MLDQSILFSGWGEIDQPAFWLAVLKIAWINILLSGDNAVVIAMACRELLPRQRLWGMILGAAVAVLLCIAFTEIVASLMLVPYLKLVGGLVLFYVAVKLLVPDDGSGDGIEAGEHLWHAVRIVAVSDTVMSLDNAIATAAAARGNMALLVIGLAISIPVTVAGAALIRSLLDQFPVLVWAGAGLLGWIVGDVITSDPVVDRYILARFSADIAQYVNLSAAMWCAISVLVLGGLWRSRRPSRGTSD